jgi:hypothetical protein
MVNLIQILRLLLPLQWMWDHLEVLLVTNRWLLQCHEVFRCIQYCTYTGKVFSSVRACFKKIQVLCVVAFLERLWAHSFYLSSLLRVHLSK